MEDKAKKGNNGAAGNAAPNAARRPARAELIWEGKYDAQGRRVAPLRVALPFQTVEMVNESAQERQKSLFAPGFREEEWRNRLIWGDKKYVLPSLLPEFAGKVNLIYIDPPFDTGADFSFTATVPDHPDDEEDVSFTFTKEPSIIEHKAYRDTWGRGRPNLTYDWRGVKRVWKFSKERMQRMHDQGLLVYSKSGIPRYKGYLDQMKGVPLQDIWIDISPLMGSSRERVDYPTQKPEALIERILKASSNENDLVLDCFCGSGTTAAVAEKLGRRWIACDLSRFAIHTTRKRLLSIPNVRPFVVQNLGKYERQLWAGAEFGEGNGKKAAERQRAYTDFILKLYDATPISGYTWLHGVKAGRMVHVGAVDAPVSVGDVTQIAAEFRRAVGTGKDAPKTNGVDVLGWDFAFELNEVAKQQAQAANIQMRFLRIPRDVMDKRAVEAGDIHFFELGALSVDVKTDKRNVFLKLKDFVIPPDDVPEEARRAVKHWSQWIDYWAVDWDNKGDTFHNEWQAYRTRKDRTLPLETTHSYAGPGEYTVVVKVIDILGNDTTKTVKVAVG